VSLFLYRVVISYQNIQNGLTDLVVLFSLPSDERHLLFDFTAFFETFFRGTGVTNDTEESELCKDTDESEEIKSEHLRRTIMVGDRKIRS
jgi:hypothetical protein